MTIRELKDSKQIPNISDSELFKIVNELLGNNSNINSLDFALEDSMVDKIKYSPQAIDMFIEQEMSKPGSNPITQYETIIKELETREAEVSKKPGMEKETQYLKDRKQKVIEEQQKLTSVIGTFMKNRASLSTIDLKSLQHLNKDAHAVFLMALLGEMEQLKPLVQALSNEVNQLHAQTQKGKTTVNTPNGQKQPEEEIVEAPPKPEFITEKKPEQKAVLNSLQDLKNKKKIPASLKDEDLIKYCNEVLKFNPPIKDMNYVMTQDKYNKLASSVFFQNAKVRSEIQHEHKGVVDKYSTLITNYQSMLDRMKGHPEFEGEIQKITELMEQLRTSQTNYKNAVVGLDSQNVEQYFDFAVSNREGISEFVSETAKGIASSQEEKAIELDAKIATLSGQVERLEKVSDKHLVTRIKRDFNINRLNNKIERLRKKQGKIKASQRKIINISTEMYKRRMEKEMAKFERDQAKMDLATQQKLTQVENLNAQREAVEQITRKMTSLEEKRREAGFIGKMRIDGQKDRLEDRKKRVQARVERLAKKVGKIDLSQQYQTSFNNNLAFAM